MGYSDKWSSCQLTKIYQIAHLSRSGLACEIPDRFLSFRRENEPSYVSTIHIFNGRANRFRRFLSISRISSVARTRPEDHQRRARNGSHGRQSETSRLSLLSVAGAAETDCRGMDSRRYRKLLLPQLRGHRTEDGLSGL